MLHEQTLFDSIDLVALAIKRIRKFEPPEGYYVAFSGGKDSIVTLDLVQRAGVKYDAHFNLTSVDPPELIKFVMQHYRYVERHRPARTMWQLIEDNMMPPTRIIRYCCRELKEHGGHGRMVITGIRRQESNKRAKRNMLEISKSDKAKTFLHPIIEWDDSEIWEYIRSNELPYPSLYDEGFWRIGCIGCPMSHDGRLRDFERWPQYKQKYLKAFDAAIKASRVAGKQTRWTTGQDLFDWWMKKPVKRNDNEFIQWDAA